jgi:HTH-type transcriptional regulator / antitoxin HigA
MTQLLERTTNYWHLVEPALSVPRSKIDYQGTVALLDESLEMVGNNNSHSLAGLMDTLATLVEAYEDEHYPISEVSAKEVLQSILEEHGLTTDDFPELGNAQLVSDILTGQRPLNVPQIRALIERFQVSPAVFWD